MAFPVSARHPAARRGALLALLALGLGGCSSFSNSIYTGGRYAAATDERECLARAMYFESNRSSPDGQLAVGTVVMNRLENPNYPKTICGVVGQKNQFAPGALTEPMTSRATGRVFKVADAVLAGARHPAVGRAMFFHTAGYSYPYKNMHYVTLAGGNMFYDKRRNPTQTQTMVASLEPQQRRFALAALETPIPERPGSAFDFTPVPAVQSPVATRSVDVAPLRGSAREDVAERDEAEERPAAAPRESVRPAPIRPVPIRPVIATPREAAPATRIATREVPRPATARAAPIRLASAEMPAPREPAARGPAARVSTSPATPAPRPLAFKPAAESRGAEARPAGSRLAAAALPPARPGKGTASYSPQAISTLLSKYDGRKESGKTTKVSGLRRGTATE